MSRRFSLPRRERNHYKLLSRIYLIRNSCQKFSARLSRRNPKDRYFNSSFFVYTGGEIQWDLVYSIIAQAFHNSAWKMKHEKETRFEPAGKCYRDDGVCALQRARFFYAASLRGASGGRRRQLCASQRNK